MLQYDAASQEIGLDERVGSIGESEWTWRGYVLPVRTRADAASIRIRIGLQSSAEGYLDVDGVR